MVISTILDMSCIALIVCFLGTWLALLSGYNLLHALPFGLAILSTFSKIPSIFVLGYVFIGILAVISAILNNDKLDSKLAPLSFFDLIFGYIYISVTISAISGNRLTISLLLFFTLYSLIYINWRSFRGSFREDLNLFALSSLVSYFVCVTQFENDLFLVNLTLISIAVGFATFKLLIGHARDGDFKIVDEFFKKKITRKS